MSRKGGEYPVMSECTKYQLLLQTDYVRLREKYDHLFNYSHIPSYIALRPSTINPINQPSFRIIWLSQLHQVHSLHFITGQSYKMALYPPNSIQLNIYNQ
jgi:hypothetical protein